VQLGQEAASEAKRQLPMLNDRRVEDFVEQVGDDLVGAIPAELRQPAFRYSFDVVNQKEINAFALPGGPMFVHRGMLEAAKSEGEVAGVMAHEIAHVALRHGTAQATKGEKFQIGAVAGQILGAIVGGRTGSVIAQGSQFGLGAYFMKYGREYEREADLLGAQIMARAGYDPHEMANMFKTIEAQGGGGGPEWLSDHPNPGNRYNAITKEASMLRVQGTANTGDFPSIRARLRGMAPAYTAEQIARRQDRRESGGPVGTSGRTIAPPSGQYRTYQAGNFLRISVPANWRQVAGGNTLTYAPDGAYVTSNGGTAFTHGLEVGVTQGTGNLQRDTQQIVQGFVRANPGLRVAGNARREGIGGRQGLTLPLSNVSDLTGDQEYISLSTTQLADGSVLFLIGVAPQPEARTYDTAFRRVRETIQIADR
jgi:peptidase M48-like protein